MFKTRYEQILDPRELDVRLKSFAGWCASEVIERVWNDGFAFAPFDYKESVELAVCEPVEKAAARFRVTLLSRLTRRLKLQEVRSGSTARHVPDVVGITEGMETAAGTQLSLATPSVSQSISGIEKHSFEESKGYASPTGMLRAAPPSPLPKKRGRSRKFSDKLLDEAAKMKEAGRPNVEIARLLYTCSAPTERQCRDASSLLNYHRSKK